MNTISPNSFPSSVVVKFQTDRETIAKALEEIAADWAEQGIDTPVIDQDGDIDPDALAELAERL